MVVLLIINRMKNLTFNDIINDAVDHYKAINGEEYNDAVGVSAITEMVLDNEFLADVIFNAVEKELIK